MSDYIIATTSTADLPLEYLNEHNIEFISYSYMMNGEIYYDDCKDETKILIAQKMREGTEISTSMINSYNYYEFFKKLLETGKNVLFLDMSKKISHSFDSANDAAQKVQAEFPQQTLYVMDTRCISGGLGLLVSKCVDLKESGKSFEEVIDWAEKNKLKIMHRFTVDDLKYLKKGGRVSNASALVGALLAIKPILYVPDDGTLSVSSKVRGRKLALLKYVEDMKKDLVNPEKNEVRILHMDALKDAEFVKSKILETFPKIAKVTIGNVGAVIGTHVGPGLITMFYLGCQRQP